MTPTEPTSSSPAPPDPPCPEKVDYITVLLFLGIVIFAIFTVGVDYFFKTDGQIFQVMAGVLTAFTGGFFTRIKSTPSDPKPPSQ
jgi:hypothetical protein